MRRSDGRILVMDFWAWPRTFQGDGMTQTGALVGTMEIYVSGAGAGEGAGPAPDLFSVGLDSLRAADGPDPLQSESAWPA